MYFPRGTGRRPVRRSSVQVLRRSQCEECAIMDAEGRFSTSPQALYVRLGTELAPIVVDVRRSPAFEADVDEAGGIVLRLSTPDDYYVARANALEDNVRFYWVVKGRREQLAGADLKVSANQWHMLTLRAEGERFTVSFDGNALFSAQTGTFPDAGKVTLWTKADSVTYFDTISITSRE